MDLALFPLHTVLFPGATLPLHVFEPRYRAMMTDVVAGDATLGIVAIRAGMEVGGHADVHPVGCLAEVRDLRRNDDGTIDLIAAGTQRFTIQERRPDDPYPRADVTALPEPDQTVPATLIADARAAIARYLAALGRLHRTTLAPPAVPDDPAGASYALAGALLVDLVERQRLLAVDGAIARLEAIVELARREAALLAAVGPPAGRPSIATSAN